MRLTRICPKVAAEATASAVMPWISEASARIGRPGFTRVFTRTSPEPEMTASSTTHGSESSPIVSLSKTARASSASAAAAHSLQGGPERHLPPVVAAVVPAVPGTRGTGAAEAEQRERERRRRGRPGADGCSNCRGADDVVGGEFTSGQRRALPCDQGGVRGGQEAHGRAATGRPWAPDCGGRESPGPTRAPCMACTHLTR